MSKSLDGQAKLEEAKSLKYHKKQIGLRSVAISIEWWDCYDVGYLASRKRLVMLLAMWRESAVLVLWAQVLVAVGFD